MKKYLIGLLCLIMLLGFSACGEPKEEVPVDQAFITDLEAGLEARWDIISEQVEENGDDSNESREYWNSLLDAEYLKIQQYKDKEFENADLGKLASDYIAAIEGAKEAVEAHDPATNYDRFWSAYSPYYGQRVKTFCAINEGGYGLKVSDPKYQDNFDGLAAEGWVVHLMETIKFEKKTDEWDSVTYEATVKNDSGYTFDYVQFEILEKDKDGNTINTTWASVENWDNDTERTFEFYPDDGTEDYVIDSEECELK